jgi:hypothetical protein
LEVIKKPNEIKTLMSIIKKIEFQISALILFILLLASFTELDADKANIDISPGARWGHVFIYDPIHKQILLFGGINKRGGSFLNDTWIWENGKWKRLDIPGPSARGFCAVAFHEKRNTVVLHGGRGNDHITNSDLWEWNGSKWRQIENNSSFKADHHQMVYLKNKNALLAFGGWNGEEVLGNTWLWSNEWDQLNVPSPPKRSAFSMVYNKKTNKVNLFGGLWINGQYADLWEWVDGQWLSLGGPYDNSSLDHHAMIYDDKLEKIIGFGGKNYRYKAQQTTFLIENNKVVAMTNEGPTGRHSFGFTYDNNSNFGYLYGGKENNNGEQIALDDFWRWDGDKWDNVEYKYDEKN